MWFGNETVELLCNNHVGSHCVIAVRLLEAFPGDVDHLGLTQLPRVRVKVVQERKKKSLKPKSRKWKGNRPRGRERCVCVGGAWSEVVHMGLGCV